MPTFYLDLRGAQYAGERWSEFERWPLYRKNAVFAAMHAENEARKSLEPKS